MKRMMVGLVTFAVLTVCTVTLAAAAGAALPKGYEKWDKSGQKMVADKKSLFYGIHYTYVDRKAMPAFKSGGKYPEGSRFVVEFFAIKDEGGKPMAGKKNMIVLMKKDRKQKATGGWLFAGFNADGSPSGIDPVKNCFECHQKEAAKSDFVISKFGEFR